MSEKNPAPSAKSQTEAKDETAAAVMSAAEAAKKIGGTIAVFARKNGKIVRDEKGKAVVETVKLSAEHIAAVGASHAVTVDGVKHAIA